MKYKLSILIVNYNSTDFIENSLYALCHLTKASFKVFLIDNDSRKSDYEKLKGIVGRYKSKINIYLKREKHNLRGSMAHGTALNQLIKMVDTPYFSVLDADATWLKKDWDEILIRKMSDRIKVIGTQGIRLEQQDFPIMFAILFETKAFKELNIDLRPTNINTGQDTGWEMREKYKKRGYQAINLEFRHTRIYKKGPFKDILAAGEYYLDGIIFASHFGRGSNPFAKKVIKTKNKIINLISMPINYLFWIKEKNKWINICKDITDNQTCKIMEKEKEFEKYSSRGADYHWKQINKFNILSFNAFVYARYCFFANEIKRLIKKFPIKIIDFGCGDGVQLNTIKKALNKEKNVELYGIDLSNEALSVAKKKTGGHFINSSVYEVPFQDESFDISISSDVIEHVNNPLAMIEEIRRVTKPDGIIIIGTPIKYTEKPLDSMHVKEYFQEEFKSLFLKEKFEILSYTETHSLFFTLLYGKTINILGKNILFFRYLVNAAAILFNKNIFLTSSKKSRDQMSYQFITLKKNTDDPIL